MIKKLLYAAAFAAGWLLATVVPPPKFIQKRVDAFFERGENYVGQKQEAAKETLKKTVREGAEKIEKKLGE